MLLLVLVSFHFIHTLSQLRQIGGFFDLRLNKKLFLVNAINESNGNLA